jgi:uncharacterized Zn finger protein
VAWRRSPRRWGRSRESWGSYDYPPYVPVAERRRLAAKEVEKRKQKGLSVEPIAIEGRLIARTFWGKSWCEHLEGYSDYVNRLPRGRTYVRNGSVLHLTVAPGRVDALVQGTSLYEVTVNVDALQRARWKEVVTACSGQIDSLVELLRGNLSHGVMRVVTDRKRGIFPSPTEIDMDCSCPDAAGMCKHIAAVLYGVGARLDNQPELLFVLRKVDHLELLSLEPKAPPAKGRSGKRVITDADLSSVFGIEIEPEVEGASRKPKKPMKARKPSR